MTFCFLCSKMIFFLFFPFFFSTLIWTKRAKISMRITINFFLPSFTHSLLSTIVSRIKIYRCIGSHSTSGLIIHSNITKNMGKIYFWFYREMNLQSFFVSTFFFSRVLKCLAVMHKAVDMSWKILLIINIHEIVFVFLQVNPVNIDAYFVYHIMNQTIDKTRNIYYLLWTRSFPKFL